MGGMCGCGTSGELPLEPISDGTEQASNLELYGTVLDNTTSIIGKVAEVNADRLVIRATTPAGTVRAVLDAGIEGVFDGLAEDDYVLCIVRAQQLLAFQEFRGICYWALKLAEGRTIVTHLASAADDAYSAGPAAMRKWGAQIDIGIGERSGACTVAILKAMLNAEFQTRAAELIIDGYLPTNVECCPGRINSPEAGYIIVAFHFRNIVQDERILLVPVKLSTWKSADSTDLITTYIRETKDSPCQAVPSKVLRSDCATVTIRDGEACLNVPYAGSVCIGVPRSVPNGTVARACYKVCKEWNVPCGVEVWIEVAGRKVASQSWGCC